MQADDVAIAKPYSVRKATSDDVQAVARIWHVGWIDGHLGHVPPELVRYRDRQEQFASRAGARLETMWVAQSTGGPVGFVVVKADEVEQLFVEKAARGTGVAAMLLRKGEAEIRSAGHRRAWLAVVAGNHRARSFYSREGWRDSGPFTYPRRNPGGPVRGPVAPIRNRLLLSRPRHPVTARPSSARAVISP